MRDIAIPPIETVILVGGRLCLDFANTANRLGEDPRDERLNTMADLFTWGERQGLLDPNERAHLAARSDAKSYLAARGLSETIELREALWRLFAGAAAGRHPSADGDLRVLNAALCKYATEGLRPSGQGFVLDPSGGLASWLWRPVAYSALELLTSWRLSRVRRCPGARCGWLFLDESPSGRRRWCSMTTCGNRHKAQRHYAAAKKPAA